MSKLSIKPSMIIALNFSIDIHFYFNYLEKKKEKSSTAPALPSSSLSLHYNFNNFEKMFILLYENHVYYYNYEIQFFFS